jgi:hypothetical protein
LINKAKPIGQSMIAIAVGIYLVAGMVLAAMGPGRKGIADAVGKVRGSPIAPAIAGEPPPPWKWILFRMLVTVGFIFLWPILIWGVLKENNHSVEASPDEWFPGDERLWWEWMGGVGTVSCLECEFSQEVTSSSHGGSFSRSGVQCQDCGQLTSILHIQEPRNLSSSYSIDKTLSELMPEDRPVRIYHLECRVRMYEMTMRETPRSKWSPTLESDLAAVRQELSTVPVGEMQAIERKRKENVAARRALHVCACGGSLDDKKPLFCPTCRSPKLRYAVRYMT